MAEPTPVNGQITDAVTQANVKILCEAPSQALATLYQVAAQTAGLGMQNAVFAQQQGQILSNAVTAQSVNLLLSAGPAAAAASSQQVLTGNALAQMLAQLVATLAANQQFTKTAS